MQSGNVPRRLEDAIDNVAANCGPSSEDGCVANLLAKFLAILLELAVLFAFHGRRHAAALADL